MGGWRWEDMKPYMVKNPKLHNLKQPKHLRLITPKKHPKYHAQVDRSKAYPGVMLGKITPIEPKSRQWIIAKHIAEYAAIDCEGDMEHPPMKEVKLIKANHQVVAGLMYYLTFKGTDAAWVEATYQTKVWLQPGSEVVTQSFAKVDGPEIQRNPKIEKVLSIVKKWKARKAQLERKRKSSGAGAFFAYVSSLMEDNPGMTFADARSEGSILWKNQLTDLEKKTFVSVAARNRKKRVRKS